MHKEEENLAEKIELVKRMTKETFQSLDEVESLIDGLQKKKATLKRDLNDLKEGRLDRIEERHRLDPLNIEYSAFTIKRKVVIGAKDLSHWYLPYTVSFRATIGFIDEEFEIHNSLTKINAAGAYPLKNGKVCYL